MASPAAPRSPRRTVGRKYGSQTWKCIYNVMSVVYHRVCQPVGCAECRPRVGRQEGGEARAEARQGDSRPGPRRLAAPPSARPRTGGAKASPAHAAAAARAAASAAASTASLTSAPKRREYPSSRKVCQRFWCQEKKSKSFPESNIEGHERKMSPGRRYFRKKKGIKTYHKKKITFPEVNTELSNCKPATRRPTN